MEQCPICFDTLIVKDCAPCYDCGCRDTELEDLARGIHTYSLYEIYDGIRLTLCNFCAVDVASYAPEFWGFPDKRRISPGDLVFIKTIDGAVIVKDKVCPTCNRRLAFLKFLKQVRDINSGVV